RLVRDEVGEPEPRPRSERLRPHEPAEQLQQPLPNPRPISHLHELTPPDPTSIGRPETTKKHPSTTNRARISQTANQEIAHPDQSGGRGSTDDLQGWRGVNRARTGDATFSGRTGYRASAPNGAIQGHKRQRLAVARCDGSALQALQCSGAVCG